MVFHYNIQADHTLGIGHFPVISIPCRCSAYLRKLDSTRNRIQDKYNKYRYNGKNQHCFYCPILGSKKNGLIIHCIDSLKLLEATNIDINVHIKQNYISNIALNIVRDIRDEDYGTIIIIDKNSESGYYLVKWTSDSYTLQSSHKLEKYGINTGGLVFDALYFNPVANVKHWYTPFEKENQVQPMVRFNTVILTKLKVKSINDVALPDRASNNSRCDSSRLVLVYACDDVHDNILDTIFARE